jgi:AbrB family looped-hinge helix DNA binding protein
MLASKVSSKSQITLPKEVRRHLNVGQGDVIVYSVSEDSVVIRKATALDISYLSALEATLSEWASPEDEKAFRDL